MDYLAGWLPVNICLNDSSTPVASRAEVSIKAKLFDSANAIYRRKERDGKRKVRDRERERRGKVREMEREDVRKINSEGGIVAVVTYGIFGSHGSSVTQIALIKQEEVERKVRREG